MFNYYCIRCVVLTLYLLIDFALLCFCSGNSKQLIDAISRMSQYLQTQVRADELQMVIRTHFTGIVNKHVNTQAKAVAEMKVEEETVDDNDWELHDDGITWRCKHCRRDVGLAKRRKRHQTSMTHLTNKAKARLV